MRSVENAECRKFTKSTKIYQIYQIYQNFCKRNETSKIPSTNFGGCKNFVRRENRFFLDIHLSLGHQISQDMDYEANVNGDGGVLATKTITNC